MSYFLSNPIPTAAQVMQGFANGGEVESIQPTGDDTFLSTLPADVLMNLANRYDVAPPATPDPGYYDPEAGQKLMALTSLIDPTLLKGFGVGDAAFGGAGTSGAAIADYYRAVAPETVGGQGSLYEEGAIEAAKRAAADPTQGLFKSGFEALAGQPGIEEAIKSKSERDLSALAKVESDFEVMKPISDLLKANKFKEAFEVADEKGVVDKMMSPGWLQQLRQPFTADEMKAFYNAIPPDYRGSDFKFDPNRGQVSESGYPEPLSAFKYEQPLTAIDAIIRLGGAAVLGAGALSALGGAGAAGAGAAGTTGAAGTAGAGAAGTGGGVLSGLKAAATKILGIPEVIGTKVGEALGASTLNSLQAKMIGNAIISGGVTGAKGGDLEDILKSAALAAGLTYVSDKAIKAVTGSLGKSGVIDAVSEIPGGDVSAVDPSVASNVADKITQNLDKVTVVGSKAIDLAQQVGGAGALTAAQAATRPGAPKQEAAAEQPETEREFKIATEGEKLALRDVASPLAIAGGVAGAQEPFVPQETVEGMQEFKQIAGRESDYGAGLETGLYTGRRGLSAEEPFVPQETVDGVQEFKQTASPEQLDASNLAIQAIMNQLPFEAAPIDPLTGLQEIVSTTAPEKLDLTDPLTQVLVNRYIDVKPSEPVTDDMEEFKIETDRDLNQGFLEIAPPIFTPVDPTQIAKDYTPTQVDSKFKSLLDKYGTVENALKVAGMLAGSSKTAAPSPVAAPYDPRAGAGAGQWIDWEKVKAEADAAGMNLNTYVARNWNKIQNRALETGVSQPAAPVVPTTTEYNPDLNTMYQPDLQMAEGGLGRYVDGPGSGRDDKIPALLSDGEYVIDAETLALLGDGSTKEGARKMDAFRSNIRKHKGTALAKGGISPNAKSPLQYLRNV